MDVDYINTTKPNVATLSWKTQLLVFEILSFVLLVITIWIFCCVIIYGFKTKRWRKRASSSSLNSGLIYAALTAAIGIFVLRLIVTVTAFILPRISNGLEWCKTVYDVGNAAYIITIYGAYMFLWVLQRLIYAHPYVQTNIGSCADWISKVYAVLFTIIAVGIICGFVIGNPVTYNENGCVLAGTDNERMNQGISRNIVSASVLFFTQLVILYLCIYPAVRVQFGGNRDGTVEEPDPSASFRHFILSSFRGKQSRFSSPIEMSVKRTLVSSIIMIVTDVSALLLSFLVFPSNAPVVLRQTIYDLSSLVNVVCMIATFGYATRVFTLCCPHRRVLIRDQRM